MPASELIERVAALIATHQDGVPAEVGAEMQALGARLREPLRVAVAGRVKAGKSTLVNALLGQRVAPTDISECTRVVTWFRYGHPERLVIAMRDGSTVEAQLAPDGTLPQELGVPVEQVASLQAYLANASLRSMTLIDTPGLGSVHEEYSRQTTELLARDSSDATASADAVVFLLGSAMMADELETLQMFQAPGATAASAVGVLSRADQLGDGSRDSWDVAVELAGKYAGTFRNEVAAVVPVIGLIAETAEAAMLTEPDAQQLARLVALEPKELARMLWSADRFTTSDAPVASEARERLLGLLDLYGVGLATRALANGAAGAVALRRELSSRSGIAAVKQTLAAYLRDQDHVLKVRSAFELLNRLSYTDAEGAAGAALLALRGDVEELRLDPLMHPIAELEIAHDVDSGRIALPQDMRADLRRVFAPGSLATRLGVAEGDPQAATDAAKAGIRMWQEFMVTQATPAQAQAARVVRRSYQMLWQAAQRSEPPQ
jgi:hypothetical protein